MGCIHPRVRETRAEDQEVRMNGRKDMYQKMTMWS
jgi:hypothetical protein